MKPPERVLAGMQARADVVEWDEFGQGYNTHGECVVCICGVAYPMRWDHYCPYDSSASEDWMW